MGEGGALCARLTSLFFLFCFCPFFLFPDLVSKLPPPIISSPGLMALLFFSPFHVVPFVVWSVKVPLVMSEGSGVSELVPEYARAPNIVARVAPSNLFSFCFLFR